MAISRTTSPPRAAPAAAAAGRTGPGDEHELVTRALRIAQRTATGVLGDSHAAQDVAQEVALIALRRRGDLRAPGALDAWLHRVAVREALRQARRARTSQAAELARHHASAPLHHDGRDDLGGALALLDGLPARQRAALTLRYVHDLDDAAIAAALRCRTGTVRSLLSRGRAALEAKLDDDPRRTR